MALTYVSARWTGPGQRPAGAIGTFPHRSRRQQVLEDLHGGRILDDLLPSAAELTPQQQFDRMAFALPGSAVAGQPDAADANLARRLALIRQDVGSFGGAQGEGLERRTMLEPRALDWFA